MHKPPRKGPGSLCQTSGLPAASSTRALALGLLLGPAGAAALLPSTTDPHCI